jgi:hypothetical protein
MANMVDRPPADRRGECGDLDEPDPLCAPSDNRRQHCPIPRANWAGRTTTEPVTDCFRSLDHGDPYDKLVDQMRLENSTHLHKYAQCAYG